MSTVAAHAGGWNNGGSASQSKGLVNISPSAGVGDVTALNNILNGNAILSGNNVSGILNGNTTGITSGVLQGIGVGVLSGNGYKLKK